MDASAAAARSRELQDQLGRVALGDRVAFERVYRMTASHLLGVALRILQRRDLAEDALQDAFVSVWHNARSYRAQQGQPMTWLISIVRNRALDVVRSAPARREAIADDPDRRAETSTEPGADGTDPLGMLEAAAAASGIRQCMERLDAAGRQCLALAYYRGMSHAEVAAHVRAPLGSVKAWIRRGLERLRECLEAAA